MSNRLKKFLSVLIGILCLVSITYIILPIIIKHEIIKEANRKGFKIQTESIELTWKEILLKEVSLESETVKGQLAEIKIALNSSWKPKEIIGSNGSLFIEQRFELTDGEHVKGTGGNSITKKLNNIDILWKGIRKPLDVIQINGLYVDAKSISVNRVEANMSQVHIIGTDILIPRNDLKRIKARKITVKKEEGKSNQSANTEISAPNLLEFPDLPNMELEANSISVQYEKKELNATSVYTITDANGVYFRSKELIIGDITTKELKLYVTNGKTIHILGNMEELIANEPMVSNSTIGPVQFEGDIGIIDNIPTVNFDLKLGEIPLIIRTNNEETYSIQITMKKTHCDFIHSSMPSEFQIEGIQMTGSMEWELYGKLDYPKLQDPDIKISINNTCKITSIPAQYNILNLRKIFERQVYDGMGHVVNKKTGPGHPDWIPLTMMSKYVPIAFRTMEDPGFLGHDGFHIEAVENSIEINIKERRFARGASTITMQLAKNLWLNREKTLVRKAKEAFLTMYLEQKLSKDQIMELYANVVEFGPDIYGIGPAARHYFRTHPSSLSLGQSLFLASLLPSPKNNGYSYRAKLHPMTMNRLHRIMKAMKERGIITELEYENGIKEELIYGRSTTREIEIVPTEVEPNGLAPDSWESN